MSAVSSRSAASRSLTATRATTSAGGAAFFAPSLAEDAAARESSAVWSVRWRLSASGRTAPATFSPGASVLARGLASCAGAAAGGGGEPVEGDETAGGGEAGGGTGAVDGAGAATTGGEAVICGLTSWDRGVSTRSRIPAARLGSSTGAGVDGAAEGGALSARTSAGFSLAGAGTGASWRRSSRAARCSSGERSKR